MSPIARRSRAVPLLAPAMALALAATTAPGSAAGASTSAPASGASSAERAFVLDRGHIDLFEVTYDAAASAPRLLVKDDTGIHGPTAYRSPEEVTIGVDADLSRTPVPASEAYSFLGEPGDEVFLLPMTQNPDLPWPGWSTERLASTLAGTGLSAGSPAVSLLVEASGPGEVHAFATDSFGSPVNHHVNADDAAPDVIPIEINRHVHTNWSFGAEGSYTLEVTPTLHTTTGDVVGATSDYHVQVGEPAVEPPAEPPSASVRPALPATLRVAEAARVSPGAWDAGVRLSYQWTRDGRPIAGARGTGYRPVAADHRRALRVEVTATDADGLATTIVTPGRRVAAGAAVRSTVRPKIVGTPRAGSTLRASAGRWSASGSIQIRWQVGSRIVPGHRTAVRVPASWRGQRVSLIVTNARAGHATGRAVSGGVRIQR